MGADGHINIYDLDAIRKELTDDEIGVVICSQVYYHEIFGKRVLTEYWGDNLYSYADDYEDRYGWSKTPEISKEKFEMIWSVIKKHKVAQWEVWT